MTDQPNPIALPGEPQSNSLRRTIVAYTIMVVGAVVMFWLIDSTGSQLTAPVATTAPASTAIEPAGGKTNALVHVLVALIAVLVVGRSLALLFRLVGQPPVIGEVVGGIILGPSAL